MRCENDKLFFPGPLVCIVLSLGNGPYGFGSDSSKLGLNRLEYFVYIS